MLTPPPLGPGFSPDGPKTRQDAPKYEAFRSPGAPDTVKYEVVRPPTAPDTVKLKVFRPPGAPDMDFRPQGDPDTVRYEGVPPTKGPPDTVKHKIFGLPGAPDTKDTRLSTPKGPRTMNGSTKWVGGMPLALLTVRPRSGRIYILFYTISIFLAFWAFLAQERALGWWGIDSL